MIIPSILVKRVSIVRGRVVLVIRSSSGICMKVTVGFVTLSKMQARLEILC